VFYIWHLTSHIVRSGNSHMKLETWTCDFKGCGELAQWYRRSKGQIVKLCTKHKAYLARQRWGKRVDHSELSEDDMRRLKTKVYWNEYDKKHPFSVMESLVENGLKVRVSDIQTGEHRSFVVKNSDTETFGENFSKLERRGFVTKPSIDDYVKKLKDGTSSAE